MNPPPPFYESLEQTGQSSSHRQEGWARLLPVQVSGLLLRLVR